MVRDGEPGVPGSCEASLQSSLTTEWDGDIFRAGDRTASLGLSGPWPEARKYPALESGSGLNIFSGLVEKNVYFRLVTWCTGSCTLKGN